MTREALIDELCELRPVQLLNDNDTVKIHYLDTGAEFVLDRDKPVHVMHSVTPSDDPTSVEVCDPNMVAIQQVAENGETQTVMLSTPMAIELARLIDSFIYFPIGLNSE